MIFGRLKSKTCHVAFLFSLGLFSSLCCRKDNIPFGSSDFTGCSSGKAMSDFGSSILLKPDGTLWSWGDNLDGELGLGTEESVENPQRIPSLSHILDFHLSNGMCLAVDQAGHIWLWGSNRVSSLIWPKILSPRKISYLRYTNRIYEDGWMIRKDGSVWNIKIDANADSSFYTPQCYPFLTDIKSLSNSMALKVDGTLLDWRSYKDPVWGGFVPIKDVLEVQNSIAHTVILKSDGTVWAWGQNSLGELGSDSLESSSEPVQVKGLDDVVHISANYHFNLALRRDGSVWFWGYIPDIRFRTDNPVFINGPVRVEDLDDVFYVYANSDCMAIKKDCTVWSFHAEDRLAREIRF